MTGHERYESTVVTVYNGVQQYAREQCSAIAGSLRARIHSVYTVYSCRVEEHIRYVEN